MTLDLDYKVGIYRVVTCQSPVWVSPGQFGNWKRYQCPRLKQARKCYVGEGRQGKFNLLGKKSPSTFRLPHWRALVTTTDLATISNLGCFIIYTIPDYD